MLMVKNIVKFDYQKQQHFSSDVDIFLILAKNSLGLFVGYNFVPKKQINY